jgi:hypothetical protein
VWNVVSDIKGGTNCWGEYLDQRGMEWRKDGENCITKSCIVCPLHQI